MGEKPLNDKLKNYDYIKTNDEYYAVKYAENINQTRDIVLIVISILLSILSLIYINSQYKNIQYKNIANKK